MNRTIPTVYVLQTELDLPRPRVGQPAHVHLSPWQAARALCLPLEVLTHAHASGQVPGGVTMVVQEGGSRVLRYVVDELAAWVAIAPAILMKRATKPGRAAVYDMASKESEL